MISSSSRIASTALRLAGAIASATLAAPLGCGEAAPSAAHPPPAQATPSAARARSGGDAIASSASTHPCAAATKVCDGTIDVPLFWGDPQGAKIQVAFRRVPRRDPTKPSLGTVYAAMSASWTSIDFVEVWKMFFGDVLQDRDLLLVDYRGAGRSSPIACEGLSFFNPGFAGPNAACSASLGDRATAFNTAAAAADLNRVLDTLGIAQVDLFGWGYGTLFGQAFLARYPDRVRTVVLDSVLLPEGFSSETHPFEVVLPRHLGQACSATPGCKLGPNDFRDRLAAALARARIGDKKVTPADIRRSLTFILDQPVFTRESVAALSAYLDGDAAPLLRLSSYALATQQISEIPSSILTPVFAYYCSQDAILTYPRSAPQEEKAEAVRRYRETPPGSKRFLPFTVSEFLFAPNQMATPDYMNEQCSVWAAPRVNDPPVPKSAKYPDVPTLLLSGGADTEIPAEWAAKIAPRFPNAKHVVVPFGGHAPSIGQTTSPCVAERVREFMKTSGKSDPTKACSAAFAPMVRRYPRKLTDLAPLGGAAPATPEQARLLRGVVLTALDAAVRRLAPSFGPAPKIDGLRGGSASFEARKDGTTAIQLADYAWIDGLPVSGTLVRALDGTVTGTLRARTAAATAEVDLRVDPLWKNLETRAQVVARLGDKTVSVTAPAWEDP